MTYNACCELMSDLETLTERGGTAEGTTSSLVDSAYHMIEDLARTFHTTITKIGVLPRELNDMRLRLTKLETELRMIEYFNSADNGDFYMHYDDINGLIKTAMETRGMDYDQPHILTWKGFVHLDKEKERPEEE